MIALSSIFEGIFTQDPNIISKTDRIIMAVGWMYAHSSEFNHPLFSNPHQRRVIESIRKKGPLALSLKDLCQTSLNWDLHSKFLRTNNEHRFIR